MCFKNFFENSLRKKFGRTAEPDFISNRKIKDKNSLSIEAGFRSYLYT
jgi:hypothetical protein